MPYKNIIFVKLLWKKLLLEDDRFIERCNDEQKGLYLMLLLLAGATNNNIPANENSLKRALNLSQSPENIAKNRDFLLSTFSKLIRKDNYLKFKKFKELHNYVRNAQTGTNENETGTARIDKNRIDKIRKEYISLKGWNVASLSSGFYGRTAKAIKQLYTLTNDENKILEGLRWASEKWPEMWTLETVVKKWPDFEKVHKQPEGIRKFL